MRRFTKDDIYPATNKGRKCFCFEADLVADCGEAFPGIKRNDDIAEILQTRIIVVPGTGVWSALQSMRLYFAKKEYGYNFIARLNSYLASATQKS